MLRVSQLRIKVGVRLDLRKAVYDDSTAIDRELSWATVSRPFHFSLRTAEDPDGRAPISPRRRLHAAPARRVVAEVIVQLFCVLSS